MKPSHKKIINALSEHKQLSAKELELLTGYSYNGLRGRISEIRKLGYIIELRDIPTKKYVFLGKTKTEKENVTKIINWLERTNNYNKNLKYSTISKMTNLSLKDVIDVMITLQKRNLVLQTSNTSAIIKKT